MRKKKMNDLGLGIIIGLFYGFGMFFLGLGNCGNKIYMIISPFLFVIAFLIHNNRLKGG